MIIISSILHSSHRSSIFFFHLPFACFSFLRSRVPRNSRFSLLLESPLNTLTDSRSVTPNERQKRRILRLRLRLRGRKITEDDFNITTKLLQQWVRAQKPAGHFGLPLYILSLCTATASVSVTSVAASSASSLRLAISIVFVDTTISPPLSSSVCMSVRSSGRPKTTPGVMHKSQRAGRCARSRSGFIADRFGLQKPIKWSQ